MFRFFTLNLWQDVFVIFLNLFFLFEMIVFFVYGMFGELILFVGLFLNSFVHQCVDSIHFLNCFEQFLNL